MCETTLGAERTLEKLGTSLLNKELRKGTCPTQQHNSTSFFLAGVFLLHSLIKLTVVDLMRENSSILGSNTDRKTLSFHLLAPE